MARPLRITYPGAFYHITSRGNERKEIYKTSRDREKFLSYLESATERYGAMIHVYCLLNNHYHLLLETPSGNLSQIMRHINGAYTTYFNTKRKRAGHLFQGRFKAILVDIDEYAKELSRYIHLNPVRAGIAERPEDHQWSSYRYYIGKGKPPEWLVQDFILGYFGEKHSVARKAYRNFVVSLLGQEYYSPLDEVVGSTILGCDDFIREIKRKYLNKEEKNRDLPALSQLYRNPTIEDVIAKVDTVITDDPALSKKLKIYFCHKYSGKKLKDIGNQFGIKESGVSQSSRRFSMEIEKNAKLNKKINTIINRLNLH